jgi:hypothetical protein
MRRRTKKVIINQPTGVHYIQFDEFNVGSYGDWETDISGPKTSRLKGLKKRNHDRFSVINFRHSNKDPRGRGFHH